MTKHTNLFFVAILLVGILFGCSKDEISSSGIVGEWSVSGIDVLVNEQVIAVPANALDANYKNVSHTFNEDGTYLFTDVDGATLNGAWEYQANAKELIINYPAENYEERFEVVTNNSTELTYKTPLVDISNVGGEQDVETLFTANFLLIGTSGEQGTSTYDGVSIA